MPRVSVVIPAHDAGRSLAETVGSVLRQAYRDFEVLVVDDGSTDGTAAVAEAIGPPVRCIRQANGGVSRARNAGIARAGGEYVAFLDADDLWAPAKLGRQVALLDARPDVGLVFTGMVRAGPTLRPIGVVPARDYPDYRAALLLHSCVVPCSSAMVRRGVLDRAGGFDPALSTCADWDFLIRLAGVARFAPIDEPLLTYRSSPGSMSSDPGLMERDTLAVIEKFYAGTGAGPYRAIEARCRGNHWMILSGSYLHAGKVGDSLRCLANAVRVDPRHAVRALGTPLRWLRRALPSRPS